MKSRFLYFVAAEVLLCLLLILFWPRFIIDDSYIFLSYARNLAQSGLFAFNPGEVSYGFSSPAYVMLLAAVSRLSGIPVGVALTNIIGVLLCGLASAAVWSLWSELEGQPSTRETLFAAVLFSGPWFFSVWFIFGMETGLAVVSLLGFLLWVAKLRAGAQGVRWLIIGVVSASVLATTRLESGIYIACVIVLALVGSSSRRQVRDLAIVGVLSGGTEIAWLLYAKRTFGTYMPWTSTARLLFYLPRQFGVKSGVQFYQLGFLGRSLVAWKVAVQVTLGGPLKILLVFMPLVAAIILLWIRRNPATPEAGNRSSLRWMLQVAAISMFLEMILFVYLFPLVQTRHLAPYIAGIWALVSLPIARAIFRQRLLVQVAATAVVALLWVGGAVQYRLSGLRLETLHRLASSGYILPGDRVAAEPIGILSFETQARIIDLGGLTDRSVWPLLMQGKHGSREDIVAWEIGRGANKLLLTAEDCGSQGHHYGSYCLIDASAALVLPPQVMPGDAGGK